MTRLLICLAAFSAACGDNAYDLYEAEPSGFKTLSLWVDPHPDIPAETAREACEAWRPEGVLCELAPSADEALIRIHAYEGECVEKEDGTFPLGHAQVGGDITLEIACLHRAGGDPPAERVLWPVVSHEVGHELGIWTHVPKEEGTALMNPMINYGLYGITPLDHQAFLVRDEDDSVLRLAEDGCTLYARD